jgi:hypothetical protein
MADELALTQLGLDELDVITDGAATDYMIIVDANTREPELSLISNAPQMGGVTASTADLNATTNFEQTVSSTTGEVSIKTGATLNVVDNGGLEIAGTAITSTAAELNVLDGVTAGTVSASKGVVVDANKHQDVVNTTTLSIGASGSATAVTSTAAELNILDGVTATAEEMNSVVDGSKSYLRTTSGTTSVALTTGQSGRTIFLPDFAAACTYQLPTEEAGLRYTFVYAGLAEDAHGIILQSTTNTNYFIGGLLSIDTTTGAGGSEVDCVYPDGNSNSKLTCATIGAGTRFSVMCNGTQWYLEGQVVGGTAPAFADQ